MRTTETLTLPRLRVHGRSFMALVVTPEPPLADWLAALDAQIGAVPGFFTSRPVVADLSAVAAEAPDDLAILLDGLELRDFRLVGVEGANPALLADTRWGRLANQLHGRDFVPAAREAAQPTPGPTPEPEPLAPCNSLLIEGPVRSGQSVAFPEGDVTIIGSVASGAEVIAGGSLHIYGALRGRAIAGVNATGGRLFCRKMHAELVGVDRLYRTADHWGPDLHGRPVQVHCDRGALRLTALD